MASKQVRTVLWDGMPVVSIISGNFPGFPAFSVLACRIPAGN
jgi:hypothetical protein